MREVNSVYRTAVTLRTALIGKQTLAFDALGCDGIRPAVGHTIEEVRTFGKNIEIVWDDGVVLHSTFRLTGSWHLYRRGERWSKPRDRAQVVIAVSDWIAVCFGAISLETFRDFDPRRHPILGKLGPNISHHDVDIEECVDRMMHYEDREATVSDVLLDQRVVSGIGNVFRCEILWACEIHPWACASELKRAECRELLLLAQESLIAQIPNEMAVYGRQGKSCHRCGDLIRVAHHGEASRVLYWCPGCQIGHQPLVSPNITPLSIDRTPVFGDTHPASHVLMNELATMRGDGQDSFN
ncbi:MAG: hypothetical protein O3A24_06015 [Actinobacteria bacterium]|jgi:endonuclease-8|nr:MAG: hypothetical protein ABR57_03245 [Acidimicrobium sp. BACL17 MAG-120924-bin0]KRO43233.1 MAG: hypothetical protein ABR67_02280 [Acidimicrobium sp. BACL17 MAG-120823-bin42]MDA0192962.1 hypothetical protein [Actinomycetota bacterium]